MDENGRRYPYDNSGQQDYDEQYKRQLKEYSDMDRTNYFDSYVDLEFQQYDPQTDRREPEQMYSQGYQRPSGQRQPRQRADAQRHTRNASASPRRKDKSRRSGANTASKHSSRNVSKAQRFDRPENRQKVQKHNYSTTVSKTENKQKLKQGGAAPLEENGTKKKKSKLKRVLLILLLIIFILFLAYCLLILHLVGKVNTVETKQRDTSIKAGTKSKDVKNILVIGSDTRDFEEAGRTDSMILLSVNTKTKEITMTSLMRDMYLPLVGYASDGTKMFDDDEPDGHYRNKLNTAYFFGGAELLMDTIKYNFDIEIDDYIYFDFSSFMDIIDSIGGIDLDVSDEEVKVMNNYIKEHNKLLGKDKSENLIKSGGKIHVNGSQALAYSRVRYVGNADFERTQRQRTVFSKVIEKVKSLGIFKKYSFLSTTMENLTTNMSRSELFFYAFKAPFYLGYDIKEFRLPEDGQYEYGSHKGGQSTLDVDIEKCKKSLKDAVYK